VTNVYEKPTRYGTAAVVRRHPVHRGADPGTGLQVVGLGGLGVRPRGYPAGDTADPAWRAAQRPLPRGRTLAWRRVHRDRRLGTLAVGNITLRERERTRPAFLLNQLPRVGVLESPHAASCISGGVSPERPGYDTNLGCEVRYWAEGKYERHHHRRREHGAGHRTPAGGWGPFGNDRGPGPGGGWPAGRGVARRRAARASKRPDPARN
jgi:hypothetical protein